MGMGYGLIFMLMPPYSFLWIAYVLVITFIAVYAGKRIFHIEKDDIVASSIRSLVWPLWGLSVAAVLVSLIVVWNVSGAIPWMSVVHSEWGIEFEKAWTQATIYYLGWMIIYFALLMTTSFLYKKKIRHSVKCRQMFFFCSTILAVCWGLPLCMLR